MVLVIIGLSFSFASAYIHSPIIKIMNLSEDYNGQHIEVEGNLVDVKYYPQDYGAGTMTLYVYDSTGIVRASLTSGVVSSLARNGKIPVVGMHINVGGIYYGTKAKMGEYNHIKTFIADGTIKVRNSNYVHIEYDKTMKTSPDDIMRSSLSNFTYGTPVSISGEVVSVRNASYGINVGIFTTNGTFSVIIPSYIQDIKRFSLNLSDGEVVKVTGGLVWYEYYKYGKYYGHWEMYTSPYNIKVISKGANYTEVSLDDLLKNSNDYNGMRVVVKKVHVSYVNWKTSSTGEVYSKRFKIGNGSATIWVYIEDWNKRLTQANITSVTVYGMVEYYSYQGGGYYEIVVREGTGDKVIIEGVEA